MKQKTFIAFCVICIWFVIWILCHGWYVLWVMCYVLWVMLSYVLFVMCCELFVICCELCAVFRDHCVMFCELCVMFRELCVICCQLRAGRVPTFLKSFLFILECSVLVPFFQTCSSRSVPSRSIPFWVEEVFYDLTGRTK